MNNMQQLADAIAAHRRAREENDRLTRTILAASFGLAAIAVIVVTTASVLSGGMP